MLQSVSSKEKTGDVKASLNLSVVVLYFKEAFLQMANKNEW